MWMSKMQEARIYDRKITGCGNTFKLQSHSTAFRWIHSISSFLFCFLLNCVSFWLYVKCVEVLISLSLLPICCFGCLLFFLCRCCCCSHNAEENHDNYMLCDSGNRHCLHRWGNTELNLSHSHTEKTCSHTHDRAKAKTDTQFQFPVLMNAIYYMFSTRCVTYDAF